MDPYWPPGWPAEGHSNSNNFHHLGWYCFAPPAPPVQPAAPSAQNLPIMTREIQPVTQVLPQNNQDIPHASRGESQARQDPWSLAERRIDRPTRRVRFVEANSRLPVAEDDVAGHIDLTRAVDTFQTSRSYYHRPHGATQETLHPESIYPAHNVEVFNQSDQDRASIDYV